MKLTSGTRVKRLLQSPAAGALTMRVKRRLVPIVSALFAYTPEALEKAIRALGVNEGDTLLVHSGFRRTSGFSGSPNDVIDCLLRTVGTRGNLLMMSMPYRGASQRYAASNPVFDVLRSPSAVGLISEVFRRRDGVLRSLNPLHPVLATGPLAAWLVADHDKTAWSCGKGSPFDRFQKLNGKFLFLDAPYRSLTFMHFVEDALQEHLPVRLYDETPAVVRVRNAAGEERQVRQFFFSQEARDRRDFRPIEERLTRDGRLKTARIGNSRLIKVDARDVVDCARALVADGTGFFR
jgi:aminoglycoside 3-N-acetyltransferase